MAMSIAREFAGPQGPANEVVALAFEQRERSRLRVALLSGEEIGIDLPPGTLLRHGDRLRLDDGRVVAVEAAPERLLEVRAHDAVELARIAYHVGNRHVPLQIGDGWMRLLPDHVLRAMIERLGGRVHEIEDGFQPESGAYGHGHVHHAHDDQGHGGRIHAFDPRHEPGHRREHEHHTHEHHTHEHHTHEHHTHEHHTHEHHTHEHGRGHDHRAYAAGHPAHAHGPGCGHGPADQGGGR